MTVWSMPDFGMPICGCKVYPLRDGTSRVPPRVRSYFVTIPKPGDAAALDTLGAASLHGKDIRPRQNLAS